MNDFTDLNEAFGKALVQQFFEPILISRGPNGEPFYGQSGVSMVAEKIFHRQSDLILEKVWEQLDVDELAAKIAELVVKDLTKTPGIYQRNLPQEELKTKILEKVAEQLGQRVVDQMDLQIGPKELSNG